jgi:glutathione synthase
MTIKLGVVMDPIESVNYKKDSTLAMLFAAQDRGWELFYMEQSDLFVHGGMAYARMSALSVQRRPDAWFTLGAEHTSPLHELDAVLMRKDPPFDMEYIFTTYSLELAEMRGTLVVNRPQSLRDINEKMFTAWFSQCTPPTLVARSKHRLREFLEEHGDVILKPLDSMGGTSVFRVRREDPNINVIIETLTAKETRSIMAQRFVPEITQGDKRILLVAGEPVPYALARIPPAGETRANLAVGGRGEGVALTDRDRWICEQVGPVLLKRGVLFAGLDVIGDYLTEINVTSPTCIRELDDLYGLDIGGQLMDAIAERRG